MSNAEATIKPALPAIPDDAASSLSFAVLHDELDQWQKEGRHCPLWWRDDDLAADSPAFRTLADLAERNGVPVLVAVIPGRASASLAQDTVAMSLLSFCQHGLHHRNNEPVGNPPSEFGMGRPLEAVAIDLREGRDRMAALFGERFLPLFVPPWNRLRPDGMAVLKELGIRGASMYEGETDGFDLILPVVNTHMDILVWSATPPIACRSTDELVGRLVTLLRSARATTEPTAPVGILTHHQPMNADSWTFMQRLFDATRAHSCVRWMSASELFPA